MHTEKTFKSYFTDPIYIIKVSWMFPQRTQGASFVCSRTSAGQFFIILKYKSCVNGNFFLMKQKQTKLKLRHELKAITCETYFFVEATKSSHSIIKQFVIIPIDCVEEL